MIIYTEYGSPVVLEENQRYGGYFLGTRVGSHQYHGIQLDLKGAKRIRDVLDDFIANGGVLDERRDEG